MSRRLRIVPGLLATTALVSCSAIVLRYDREKPGADDGGLDASAIDGGGDAAADSPFVTDGGVFVERCGDAQFCDDFDTKTSWQNGWTPIPNGGAAAIGTVSFLGGLGLGVTANAQPGGNATPTASVRRRGTDKTLSVRFRASFRDKRASTFLILEDDPPSASTGRLSIKAEALYVDSAQALPAAFPPGDEPFDVALTIVDLAGATRVTGTVGGGSFDAPLLSPLGDTVRIRFAQEPITAGDAPCTMIFDDIIID